MLRPRAWRSYDTRDCGEVAAQKRKERVLRNVRRILLLPSKLTLLHKEAPKNSFLLRDSRNQDAQRKEH